MKSQFTRYYNRTHVSNTFPALSATKSENNMTKYNNPPVGCYVDTSCQSADDCNQRTIEFAEDYGFEPGKPQGCFDGLRGLYIEMDLEDAESGSHSGQCDEDIAELVKLPYISEQLDKIDPDTIRAGLRESGAWDAEELADDEENRKRAVWLAACDIRENKSEWLDETANDAVDFLNDLETRSFMSWQFEDNSLFLLPDIDGAKDDVGFASSKTQDYPDDDYEGEWLHISDHGNATLYVRENGKDREIWSIV